MAESGIYEIVNLVNGKRYVGSACNLKQRKIDHWKLLRRGTHHSRYLQASWNKYGEDAFEFRLIESVAEKERLVEREQHYFDILKPEYNIAKKAGSCLGVRHTAEAKAKMSAKHKGKKLSAEHIAKIVANNTGRKASPESIARMKAAQRRRLEENPEYAEQLRERQRLLTDNPKRVVRLREVLTGRPSPLRGKKQTPEQIEKRAAAHRGRKRSPETRAKIAAKAKGRKMPPRSAEYRAKMSAIHKGRKLSAEHMEAFQEGRRRRIVSEDERTKHRTNTKARWERGGAKAFGR